MNVGRSAPRYQAMALLYPQSKKLEGYLCEYFIAIVHLCHQTMNFAGKSTLAQISSTLVDSDLKNFQSELELWANSTKEEVTLLTSQKIDDEVKDSSKFRDLVTKSAASTSYQKILKARLLCLDAFSIYDYETLWKQFRKRGSPTWFTQVDVYRNWTKREVDVPLFVQGTLGSGKTILMASMIDDLILSTSPVTVAYFFCRHDISESLKARTIIGSLARQLLQQTDDIDTLINEENLSRMDSDQICWLIKKYVIAKK